MLEVYPEDPHKLTVGDTFSFSDLEYPILLESDNNAAEAVATTSSVGYSGFISSMNSFVQALHMTSTSFRDASGLSDGNVSTADDLFIFAQYLYQKEPELLATTRVSKKVLEKNETGKEIHGEYTFLNTNVFVGDPNYLGGKTGRTDAAGETMFSLFKYSIGGHEYPVAIIVLHSNSGARQADSEALYIKTIEKIEQTGFRP
jgi:D-alanyl-D-alanine endopeptidase (penicillin-binding protein 7)